MQNIAHTIVTTVSVDGTGTGLIRNAFKKLVASLWKLTLILFQMVNMNRKRTWS